MTAVIGITSNLEEHLLLTLSPDYLQAIYQAGGTPFVLPNLPQNTAELLIKQLDGLLLTGGGDLDPLLFGEEPHPQLGRVTPLRDYFELAAIKVALRIDLPIFAICRGCQVLNVALGGDLFQDIYSQQAPPLLQHSQQAPRTHATHYVTLSKDSLIEQIVQQNRLKVNSFHHQAVRHLPTSLQVSGVASDGIIEVIESTKHPFVLGVQWHPEALAMGGDEASHKLFRAFVAAAKQFRQNKSTGGKQG